MTPPAPRNPRRLLHPDELADPAGVRPEGGSVFEMHAHSSDYSRDSGVRVGRIADQAVERGLDGVVLTEHNAIWDAEELRQLSERHEIRLLPGMEIGTDVGHVLVYGLERFTHELLEIGSLRRIVQSEGAVMALAHPMRPFHGQHAAHDRYEEWFDALETINGDHADTEDGPFELIAKRLGIGAIGGSDVHSVQAVGRAVTTFESQIDSVEELVDQLRAVVSRPRDLRPRRTLE